MKFQHILMVSGFSVGMGIGQLLLKFSAQRQSSLPENSLVGYILSLFTDWAFLLGIVIYGILLLYWVWLLSFLPLSKAYPFTLLSLILTAIGGAIFFQEALTARFVAGLLIIGFGLLLLGSE